MHTVGEVKTVCVCLIGEDKPVCVIQAKDLENTHWGLIPGLAVRVRLHSGRGEKAKNDAPE